MSKGIADRSRVADAARDAGATAVEYALMVSFIAIAVAVTVGLLGTALDGLFATVLPGL